MLSPPKGKERFRKQTVVLGEPNVGPWDGCEWKWENHPVQGCGMVPIIGASGGKQKLTLEG